jgi:hypothetical protein
MRMPRTRLVLPRSPRGFGTPPGGRAFPAALGGAVALILLAGCANLRDAVQDAGDSGPRSIAYRCDDDRGFMALFSEDRDQAFVETGDETYELALVDRDDDQLTYANQDDVHLAVDDSGRDAYLRVPGENDLKDCRAST